MKRYAGTGLSCERMFTMVLDVEDSFIVQFLYIIDNKRICTPSKEHFLRLQR